MCKKIALTALLVTALSISAFAGEGSDTVGGGKLLPQLRYGYSVSAWKTTITGAHQPGLFVSPLLRAGQLGHPGKTSSSWAGRRPVLHDGGFRDFTCYPTDNHFRGRNDRLGRSFMWGLGVRGTSGGQTADSISVAARSSPIPAPPITGGSFAAYRYSAGPPVIGEGDTGDIFNTDIYQLTADLHAGWHIKSIGLTPYVGVDYTWARMVTEYVLGGFDSRIESDPRHPGGYTPGSTTSSTSGSISTWRVARTSPTLGPRNRRRLYVRPLRETGARPQPAPRRLSSRSLSR